MKVDLPFVSKTFFSKWRKCEKSLDYEKSSSNGCNRFYQNGKVFLACDVFGCTRALKFYSEKASDWKKYNGQDREKDKPASKKEAEEIAKKERGLWQKLYPQFKQCTCMLDLNHHVVLKMPYLTPLPPGETT